MLYFHYRFYMTAMLPEIASPRFLSRENKSDIREFLYVEAQKLNP